MRYLVILFFTVFIIYSCKKDKNTEPACTDCVTISGTVLDSFTHEPIKNAGINIYTHPESLLKGYFSLYKFASTDGNGHFQIVYKTEEEKYWCQYFMQRGGTFHAWVDDQPAHYSKTDAEVTFTPGSENTVNLIPHGKLSFHFSNLTGTYSSHQLRIAVYYYYNSGYNQRTRQVFYDKSFSGNAPDNSIGITYPYNDTECPYSCQLISLTNGDVLYTDSFCFQKGEIKTLNISY